MSQIFIDCFTKDMCICLTYWTVFISAHKCSHFYCYDFLPYPTMGEWANSCVVLNSWLWLNHSNGSCFSFTYLLPALPLLSLLVLARKNLLCPFCCLARSFSVCHHPTNLPSALRSLNHVFYSQIVSPTSVRILYIFLSY